MMTTNEIVTRMMALMAEVGPWSALGIISGRIATQARAVERMRA